MDGGLQELGAAHDPTRRERRRWSLSEASLAGVVASFRVVLWFGRPRSRS